ncbi:MAG TPA: hypothetical protein EYO33_12435 [Phycisphaerales bacterium]|nr:hypothetical protein [Phycisphaerales bacterium]
MAVAGLISLLILLCLGLVPSFKLSNRQASLRLHAGRLAQSTLEQKRSEPFEDVVGNASEKIIVEGQPYDVEVVVGPGSRPDITKRVRVVVRWDWKGRTSSIFRETILVRVPR